MSLILPNDAVATVPLAFTDQVGRDIPPPSDGAITSSDPTVLTAALSVDGAAVVITPVAPTGTAAVAYAGGGFTATLSVSVVEPVLSMIAFKESAVTFAPKVS